MITVKTLSLRFTLPLTPAQIPVFRGAVAESAGWEHDLFHNHAPSEVGPVASPPPLPETDEGQAPQVFSATEVTLKDKFLHRYPLIQYRVDRGQAGIFALGDGVVALRQWLGSGPEELDLNGHKCELLVDAMRERRHPLSLLPTPRRYRLLDYLALNQQNYQTWQGAGGLIERMQLLQGALTGHLLGLCTAFGYRVPDRQLQVKLLDLRNHRPVKLHDTPYLAFGLVYETNLALPPGIALGRGVAYGYGRQQPVRRGR
jgi:hypothetical protein